MQKGISMAVFKDIFSWDLFKKGLGINNTPYLAYITFLMILYVAYGYHVDSVVMRISKESKKGEKLYSESDIIIENNTNDIEAVAEEIISLIKKVNYDKNKNHNN